MLHQTGKGILVFHQILEKKTINGANGTHFKNTYNLNIFENKKKKEVNKLCYKKFSIK